MLQNMGIEIVQYFPGSSQKDVVIERISRSNN